jgi:hypothetical protein
MAVSTPDPHTQQRMVAYQAVSGQGAVRRFRTPAQFDVLSGRGGSVNKHFGNIYFREIVKGRKVEYNRAKKDRKTEICREVMERVSEKGGTFLVKENENSSSAFWTEQSDDRTMAKVSQALREGAPKIRETLGGAGSTRKRESRDSAAVPAEVRSSHKRVRIAPSITTSGKQVHPSPSEVTPPLTTATAPASVTTTMPHLALWSSSIPPPKPLLRSESSISLTGIIPDGMDLDNAFLDEDFVNPFGSPDHQFYGSMLPPALPKRQQQPMQRNHSLCLSDISAHPNDLEADFINPFDGEEAENDRFNHQWSFSRQTSTASDMGGLGSLLRNNNNNDDDDQQQQQKTARRPWLAHDYDGSSSSLNFESSPALIAP